jgi:O-antigen ligase
MGLVIVLLLAMILGATSLLSESRTSSFLEASLARMATLANPDTVNESSLQWRFVETDYALQQVVSHPLLGLGLGAQYRPFDSRIDYVGQGWDARGYIHNAHLWIMVDTGLLGYACLVWLSILFLIRGFQHWREIKDPKMQSLVLGTTLAYLGLLFTALVNPIFMQWGWVPVLGIILSVNEVVFKMNQPEFVDLPTENLT